MHTYVSVVYVYPNALMPIPYLNMQEGSLKATNTLVLIDDPSDVIYVYSNMPSFFHIFLCIDIADDHTTYIQWRERVACVIASRLDGCMHMSDNSAVRITQKQLSENDTTYNNAIRYN